MNEVGIGNLNFNSIFASGINDIFLQTYNGNISNEYQSVSKEELPIKQPIKFILTKQESPSVSLLQKKINVKPNDSSTESDNSNNGRWTREEQNRFAEAVLKYGNDWKNIQNYVSTRNITQVRSHAQKFLMKLKESNFLKNKGMEQNLSWTKIMDFLNKTLTHDELKDVLFSVEQTAPKKSGYKNHKSLSKIQNKQKQIKKNNISENNNGKSLEENNHKVNEENNNNYYDNNLININEEENYTIRNRKIKEEEEERELQKYIECFNSSSGEITLNSSFEENSNKCEEGFRYDFLNENDIKINKSIFI